LFLNETYDIGVIAINPTTVSINISTTPPKIANFEISEIHKFDLNGDGVFDLEIKLEEIVNNISEFKFRLLIEDNEVVEEDLESAVIDEPSTESPPIDEPDVEVDYWDDEGEDDGELATEKTSWLFYSIVGFLSLMIAGILFMLIRSIIKRRKGSLIGAKNLIPNAAPIAPK